MHVVTLGTGDLSLMRSVRIRIIRSGPCRERIISASVTDQACGGRGRLGAGRFVAARTLHVCREVPVYEEAMAGAGRNSGMQVGRNANSHRCEDRCKHDAAYRQTHAVFPQRCIKVI